MTPQPITKNRVHPSLLTTILAVSTAFMTACGGGGSEDSQPSPQAITDQRAISLDIPENAQLQERLNSTIRSIETLQAAGSISASAANQTLILEARDMVTLEKARFSVTTDANTRYIVTVNGDNTSAHPLVHRAQTLVSLSAPTMVIADDLTLANAAIELAYLARQLDADQRLEAVNENTRTADRAGSDLAPLLDTLSQVLANYLEGGASELDLQSALDSAGAGLFALDQAGATIIERVRDTLNTLQITLPRDLTSDLPVSFDPALNRYTRFSDDQLGQHRADGTFAFDPDLDILNTLFPFGAHD